MKKSQIKSGNNQAERLPKQSCFRVDEVEGNEIVPREPKRNLGEAFAALGAMPNDFMSGRRQDRPPKKRNV